MRGPQTEDKKQQQLARDEEATSSNTGLDCKDESRLARVKRALLGQRICNSSDTLSHPETPSHRQQQPHQEQPRSNSGRCFGAPLELVELQAGFGVPRVVCRLCSYIEANGGFREPALFRLTTGGSRVADKLRLDFERRGNADLEGAACPAEAALLLRQWIKELPEPIVGITCVAKLLHLHVGLRNKNRELWISETRQLLMRNLPKLNLKLLGYLLNFLGRFEAQHGTGTTGISGIFAPLLLSQVPPTTLLLRDLVLDAALVFPDLAR
ncbi:hypothetical protein QAD02_004885 [Eretmocerus hayati]|uniref:Uncharacterized protein n=1 Tax=Eretmocerus hayati TaxID=131215 RepID=A0ACC2NS05_9HYME|nr:hypothetical protein QAD02_004885 [Eretmocerus hayati]